MNYDDLKILNKQHKKNLENIIFSNNDKRDKDNLRNRYIFYFQKENNRIFLRNNRNFSAYIETIIYEIKTIKDIIEFYNKSSKFYISNLSFIKQYKEILETYELERIEFVTIIQIIRRISYINKLEIKRINNINIYESKLALLGIPILYKKDNLVLVYRKNNDIFIVSDLKLKLYHMGLGFSHLFCDRVIIDNLDISDIDTLAGFFESCSKTKEIVLKNFNTKNIGSFNSMFDGCTLLRHVNVEDFDTSNATSFSYMFRGCLSINSLDLHNWNTENILYLNHTFEECSNLEYLNISTWQTPHLRELESFVSGCTELKYLDLRGIPIGYNKVRKYNWNKNCLYLEYDY